MRPLIFACLAALLSIAPALAEEKPQNVIVAPVVKGQFVDTVEALGTTIANESVSVTASVSDKITEINFEDGQEVEEGDLLAALKRDEQRAALAAAEIVSEDNHLEPCGIASVACPNVLDKWRLVFEHDGV